ncbi:unnamed protein product [Caenorhabditis auriculariae]|uniref:Uncharacterized protein n=1 Tax=Caenorhabditis auriculariae TaxID=2777116 RepID=A0A8S1H2Q9_9PELO|nr:unnamed protein product [Caenorhabditis auriculariae]
MANDLQDGRGIRILASEQWTICPVGHFTCKFHPYSLTHAAVFSGKCIIVDEVLKWNLDKRRRDMQKAVRRSRKCNEKRRTRHRAADDVSGHQMSIIDRRASGEPSLRPSPPSAANSLTTGHSSPHKPP